MTDRAIAFVSALSIHGAALLGSQAFFVEPVEYGVEAGLGGVEIDLVAAPAVEATLAEKELHHPEERSDEGSKDEILRFAQDDEIAHHDEVAQSDKDSTIASVVGDGSSSVPGQDSTTLSSGGGAVTNAKPGYLRNHAPRYPERARQLGQEGVVILWAHVSASGAPVEVQIKQSSGFPLLDEAALKAVRRWSFEPARVGSLAMDSTVEIPVRFQLKDER